MDRKMVSPDNNLNSVFDCGLIVDIPVPGGYLPALDPPGALWSCQTPLSVKFDDSFGNSDGFKEVGSPKILIFTCSIFGQYKYCWLRTGPCSASGSKACREKIRRHRLNDKFLELGSIVDPGRPLKMDKAIVLIDAIRMVTQLRDEAQGMKDINESLQEKINDLKAEKNELHDEKQRLKSEKENLEQQVKALSTQPGFLLHPSAMSAPFSSPGQFLGGKPLCS
ncbi:HLH domain-containing protein [Cephalotus follicularis]|uniref:HLH domain-containing protein n=1 Tax=Cephalotus follicularis TaxID=3775 RepID=A0A1Q3BTQ9_CEPFO|nr:HLH domain-containing protein [Cephalotus follicularis]